MINDTYSANFNRKKITLGNHFLRFAVHADWIIQAIKFAHPAISTKGG